MTDDTLDPNSILELSPPSATMDKIEKAFKSIRTEEPESQNDFDFGIDEFSWM